MTQRVVEGGLVALCLASWAALALGVRFLWRTYHLPRRLRGA